MLTPPDFVFPFLLFRLVGRGHKEHEAEGGDGSYQNASLVRGAARSSLGIHVQQVTRKQASEEVASRPNLG